MRGTSGGADNLASTSAGHLFQLIRDGTVQTRRELIDTTGLSRVTVTQRVDALIRTGYLREHGEAVSTGGRRPRRLVPAYEPKTILTAALGATRGRLALHDGSGAMLSHQTIESRIASGPTSVLTRVSTQLKRMLTKCGRSIESVCGIGIGLPGPVNFDDARLVRPPIMPGWDDYPIRQHLGEAFDAPVFVDNDANLMALGESRIVYPDLPSLLFVKFGTGIGAGLVLNGGLYRGVDGGAGDIGHVKIPAAQGMRCSCGLTGCVAAIASGAAIAHRLRAAGRPNILQSRDVAQLVAHSDPEAITAVRDAGLLLGDVLATAVSLLNPSALVIGGDMGLTYDHLLTAVREVLYQRTQPLAIRHLHIATSRLADDAGIAGAAEMVRTEIFSPAVIDATLDRSGR